MGQLVIIYAKKDADLAKLNKALWDANIDNSFTTEGDNIAWLEDINTNPDAPQRHLKPKDRDLTMEELIRSFGIFATVGAMSFDVAFGRTSDKDANKYAAFIKKHAKQIEAIKGGDELIKRYEVSSNEIKAIKSLTVKEKDPEMLPVEEQTKPDLQSGLFLCKSWGLEPFWVVFGNVERPCFLKEKKYKDDLMNNIYRDKKGLAYLMIPLLPLNNRQVEFVQEVYEHAYNLGLRENYNFIIPLVYGLDLVNLNEVAQNYKETYTPEELQDRFKRVFQMTNSMYPYNGSYGFIWRDDKKRFVPTGGEKSMQINTRCSILTALARAIGGKYAAVLTSELTGSRYVEFEFKI